MVSERASQQTFFGVSALLFVASAALTTAWCGSMSAMGEMPMPGGWTMSMAWVRMPGQTWPGAAASFLRMWVVMMVAMMLPSLVPALWRYRQARRDARQQALALADRAGGPGVLPSVDRVRNRGLSAEYRIGGHRDATTNAGANRSDGDRCGGSNRRRSPVHRVESASACVLPRGAGTRTQASGGCRHCLATWAAPRHPLQLRVCWSNGDPPRCRGHGSPGHGSRYGRNHCRTASTEWQTCRASYRGHRRSGRDVLDRDSKSRALMTRSLQFKSDTNSPRYIHVPNCAWTATLASWEGADGETQA
jgi:hypothetical protein